jgi:hypothetical protein
MSSTKNVVENFQTVLKELEVTGPDERWRAMRRLSNTSLRLCELRIQYEKQGGDSGLTEKDRANIKEAIELRREVYRRLKKMRKSKR